MDADRLIAATNARLKKVANPLRLERRGRWLWARGILPAKPHLSQRQPYQQRFALRQPVTPIGIREAEFMLARAGAAVRLKEFDWNNWITDPILNPTTAGDWIARFEQDYWRKRKRTSASAQNNWKIYRQVFNKLAANQPLTVDGLIEVLAMIEPDTRARQRAAMVLAKLANMAELPTVGIKALAGNYSAKSVEPRDLPSDPEIETMIDGIASLGWRWVAGMMAAYGLRNHEVFHLNLSEWPTVWVEDPTKTGKRFVYPLHPQWCDRWQLCDRKFPELQGLSGKHFDWDNSLLGTKTSKWFAKHNLCKPYDLRHCYARRCFEHQFPADLTAKLMGHSMAVQLKIYRAWWGEATYRRLYEELIAANHQ
ncbi:MAG: integrase [Acaryochloridaceae cyanobacterium SU_2_1]|nr:integrase [Acaryochloridaceae cyanobacterium SU_2_1]